MVAKSLRLQNACADAGDGVFRQICLDILASESSRVGNKANGKKVKEAVSQLIDRFC